MVLFEDTARRCEKLSTQEADKGTRVLVMRITNPGERAQDTDGDGEVGDYAHNQDRIVVVLVVDENECNAENEPDEAGCRATRMNTA